MIRLRELPEKAQDKVQVRLVRLAALGHQLRRPEADLLRDGIFELRARSLGLNLRILYFFHGREGVVVSHGIFKQQASVPEREIELALERKRRFAMNPGLHTWDWR